MPNPALFDIELSSFPVLALSPACAHLRRQSLPHAPMACLQPLRSVLSRWRKCPPRTRPWLSTDDCDPLRLIIPSEHLRAVSGRGQTGQLHPPYVMFRQSDSCTARQPLTTSVVSIATVHVWGIHIQGPGPCPQIRIPNRLSPIGLPRLAPKGVPADLWIQTSSKSSGECLWVKVVGPRLYVCSAAEL